jgi:CRP-like cAMP-binding protein
MALADHAFLEGFEDKHLEIIENCVAGRSVWKQGETMLLRGGPAETCHLIVDGTVAIEIRSPGSAPRVFQTLQGGDVLGWSWMFEPRLWTFDARAVTETTAFTLDAVLLRKEMEDDCEFGLRFGTRMTQAVVNRLKAARLQVLDVYNH